jgi:hypothetical protein
MPPSAVPAALPAVSYWQAWAVPEAVQVMVSPAASTFFGQLTAMPLSSLTPIPEIDTLLWLRTT